MVTSTPGPSERDLEVIRDAVRQIKSELNLNVCTSLGPLKEGVSPDLLCLAKGLTGGYLPMATTLATVYSFARWRCHNPDATAFDHRSGAHHMIDAVQHGIREVCG